MTCLGSRAAITPLLGTALLSMVATVCGCEPTGPDDDAWLEIGRSNEFEFEDLEDGDTLEMVQGGQGSMMFPLPIRGGGFSLSDTPDDWTHPDTPKLDMNMTVDGHEYAAGGYFIKIANWPVPFDVLEDGTYEFIFVTLFVPDDEIADLCDVHGLDARIQASIRPYEQGKPLDAPPVETSVDVVIAVPGCS